MLISAASVVGCLLSLAKTAAVNCGEFALHTHTGSATRLLTGRQMAKGSTNPAKTFIMNGCA